MVALYLDWSPGNNFLSHHAEDFSFLPFFSIFSELQVVFEESYILDVLSRTPTNFTLFFPTTGWGIMAVMVCGFSRVPDNFKRVLRVWHLLVLNLLIIKPWMHRAFKEKYSGQNLIFSLAGLNLIQTCLYFFAHHICASNDAVLK